MFPRNSRAGGLATVFFDFFEKFRLGEAEAFSDKPDFVKSDRRFSSFDLSLVTAIDPNVIGKGFLGKPLCFS